MMETKMEIKTVAPRGSGPYRIEIHEGQTWPGTDTPRSTLDVEVWAPVPADGEDEARISWPSTSDKRPILAVALSEALQVAFDLATSLEAEAVEVSR